MIKDSNILLFIDTYQNLNKTISALGMRLHVGPNWYAFVIDNGVPSESEKAVKDLYSGIRHLDWISEYLQNPEFNYKIWVSKRHPNIIFMSLDDFVDELYCNKVILVDVGEQLQWFAKWSRLYKFTYTVKTVSLNELGDDRDFIVPTTYTKSELNEIEQRLVSISLKIHELFTKFGLAVMQQPNYLKLKELLEHGPAD